MRTLPNPEANLQVLMVNEYSPEVAEIFIAQYFEIRGSWERESWWDRVAATLQWYEARKWVAENQRWLLKA